MTKKVRPNEIAVTRIFPASLTSIWSAWSEPSKLAQWWGPRGFKITTHEKELRVGGMWHYTMHGPDGVNYPNKTRYLVVETLSKLVYDHGGTDERAPLFRVTVDFTEESKNTRMDMTMTLPSIETAESARKFIRAANGESTWDRLAEFLEKEATGKEKFIIAREFDFPIHALFETWTRPRHMSKWVPPTGFKMEFKRSDIAPKGSSFYVMYGEEKGIPKMYGRTEYSKIEKPELIEYVQQFCDENEKISGNPFSPTWPESIFAQINLYSVTSTRTLVTVTWEPYGTVKPDELNTFIHARVGVTQGWNTSFDKLEKYLSQRE